MPQPQPVDPTGHNVLITGANRGIGLGYVDAFLDAGAAKVYAAVRSPDTARPLVDKHGDRVVPIRIDLTDPKSIIDAARHADDASIVVNNAGVLNKVAALDDEAIESLGFEIDVNVNGLIRMAQAFAPVLANRGGGAFVQLNSVVSVKNFPAFATYGASKAAAYSITQALRQQLAEQGTLVVSVHPGPIDTDMAAKAGLEGEPTSVVTEATLAALREGRFHVFPDTMARDFWAAYRPFAEAIVEPAQAEA